MGKKEPRRNVTKEVWIVPESVWSVGMELNARVSIRELRWNKKSKYVKCTRTSVIVQWIRKNRSTVKRHFYTFFHFVYRHILKFIRSFVCSAIVVFVALLFICVKMCKPNEWDGIYDEKGLNPNRITGRFEWAVTFSLVLFIHSVNFTPFCWAMKSKFHIKNNVCVYIKQGVHWDFGGVTQTLCVWLGIGTHYSIRSAEFRHFSCL